MFATHRNQCLLVQINWLVFMTGRLHLFDLLFHDGGRYHIETSPLICPANQWTGFYMITASVMKELTLGNFQTDVMSSLFYQF